MPFVKGRSGNPAGRKPGPGKVGQFRALLESHAVDLIEVAIRQALTGDSAMLRLCLDKIVPNYRSVDPAIAIPRPDFGDDDIANQSHIIIDQLLSGGLAPDVAARIMQSLTLHQAIVELKALEARIAALETGNANTTSVIGPAE